MSTPKVFDDGMSLKHPVSRVEVRRDGWTDGEVLTPHGIVAVYAQGDESTTNHTRLDVVVAGRLYMRNFSGKRYSPRGLVTVAAKFAKEIATGRAALSRASGQKKGTSDGE